MNGEDVMSLGFHDRRRGANFDPRYENWPPILQYLYEVGRLMKVEFDYAGIDGPAWPVDDGLPAWVRDGLEKLGGPMSIAPGSMPL